MTFILKGFGAGFSVQVVFVCTEGEEEEDDDDDILD
jgi:hypothetical protein